MPKKVIFLNLISKPKPIPFQTHAHTQKMRTSKSAQRGTHLLPSILGILCGWHSATWIPLNNRKCLAVTFCPPFSPMHTYVKCAPIALLCVPLLCARFGRCYARPCSRCQFVHIEHRQQGLYVTSTMFRFSRRCSGLLSSTLIENGKKCCWQLSVLVLLVSAALVAFLRTLNGARALGIHSNGGCGAKCNSK